MVGEILQETVGDFYGNPSITYPLSEALKEKCTKKYDFHLQKPGHIWLYVDSCNNVNHRIWQKQKKVVEEKGGKWRIVESKTAKIVAEGGE